MFAAVRRLLVAMPISLVTVPEAAAAPVQPLTRPHDGPTSVQWEDGGRDVEMPTRGIEAIVASPSPDPAPVTPAAEPFTEFQVRPVLDLTITIGAAAPSLALGFWVERSLPLNVPTPGSEADVGRFDRVALGRFEEAPATASDVLLAVSVAAPLVYLGMEAGLRRRGWGAVRGRGFLIRYGTDVLIFAQALAINSLLTEILKASIGRPRPYSYLDPDEVDPDRREALERRQERFDADWSFPSGHTSTAFAASTAGATLLTIKLLGRSRWGIALAWVGGTAVATTTAAMRVLAGRHFPSDVVTSALLGGAVGAAVPLAHWRPPRPGDRADRRRHGRGRWAVAPMGGPQMGGIRVWGALP
jgi:membrane-associated phospholipid phosphatase